MRYVAKTPLLEQMSIDYAGPSGVDAAGRAEPEVVDDPWDSWIFRINAGGSVEGEELECVLLGGEKCVYKFELIGEELDDNLIDIETEETVSGFLSTL